MAAGAVRDACRAALEERRTGRLGDIVATIQGEQDEIIRSPQHGVLVVQGGPGTGKTGKPRSRSHSSVAHWPPSRSPSPAP